MKISSLAITTLIASLSQFCVAKSTVNVVTTSTANGETRHLASGEMRCRVWEVCGLLSNEQNVPFSPTHEWVCSFDEQADLEGHSDKVLNLVGVDLKEFLKINGVVSGNSILVIAKGEFSDSQIEVNIGDVLGLETYNPGKKKIPIESEVAGLGEVGSITSVSIDSSGLKYPDSFYNEGIPLLKLPKSGPGQGPNRRNLAATQGTLKTLVVKVNSPSYGIDSLPAAQMSADIFTEEYCLKTQYARCSYDKLQIQEYIPGNGVNVPTIAPGVVEVDADTPGAGTADNWEILFGDDARIATEVLFGFPANSGGLSSIFDLVVFCMPPITNNWVAYAYVNRYDSYYNDDWCLSMSAQMHEVGHNIGLQHAGEYFGDSLNQEYGDLSGYMAFGSSNKDFPVQCFNPVNNWQLGWYPEKVRSINPNAELSSNPMEFKLNGFVDYDFATNDGYVVLKVGRWYIGYNRATEFNSDTREAANLVTVHEKLGFDDDPADSKLVGRLEIGADVTFDVSDNVQVNAKYERNEGGKDAFITLTLVTPPNDCSATTTLELDLTLDVWPGETSWGVYDFDNQLVVFKDGYSVRNQVLTETVPNLCQCQKYYFVMEDTVGDGICCGYGIGSFEGKIDGETIFAGGEFRRQIVIPFEVPCTPDDAAPTEGPTKAPTSAPTVIPTNSPTFSPTFAPTSGPTTGPTFGPTSAPTSGPTTGPTSGPTAGPTFGPTSAPTSGPTPGPTSGPTTGPTFGPTSEPTSGPTTGPTSGLTASPTESPTLSPTFGPTASPTVFPTSSPTFGPTTAPTESPTLSPTFGPTASPTVFPTSSPTFGPTTAPTESPTSSPTFGPTSSPTTAPTAPRDKPANCVDDTEWGGYRGRGNKDCVWVAKKSNSALKKFCIKNANKKAKKNPGLILDYCKSTCWDAGFTEQCPATPTPTVNSEE